MAIVLAGPGAEQSILSVLADAHSQMQGLLGFFAVFNVSQLRLVNKEFRDAIRSFPWVTVEIDDKDEEEEEEEEEDNDKEEECNYSDSDETRPKKKVKFSEGEYSCTNLFSASIFVGFKELSSERAGRINGVLIDRPGPFFAACDAESQDLQEVSIALFNSNGTPRYRALKSDPECAEGGFLYISYMSLKPEFRINGSTDIGLEAIISLLSLPSLSDRWTVVAYMSDAAGPLTEDERREEVELMHASFQQGEPEAFDSKEADLDSTAMFRSRKAIDSRQFLRAGFEEADVDDDGGILFCTRRMFKHRKFISHSASLDIPLKATTKSSFNVPVLPSCSAVDQELFDALKKKNSDLNAIDSIISRGADPSRALALHCAVMNGASPRILQLLVERGANVNGRDRVGYTPLMLAATQTSLQDKEALAKLIELGADSSLQDSRGKTALGYYYESIRSQRDFRDTFCFNGAGVTVDASIKTLLTPPGGATTADLDCLSTIASESDLDEAEIDDAI